MATARHTPIRTRPIVSTDAATCALERRASSSIGSEIGALRIRAEQIGSRTAVVDAYRTAPFHLGLPNDRDGNGAAELIIQGVGPGYLPGDRLTIDISVGGSATLAVRGQGATKLFPSPHGVPANAHVSLSVDAGGRLMYMPGELIPFRQAVLEQDTRINVAQGGAVALGEILTPGRIAMGEEYQFTRLHLNVEARNEGLLCLIERARLDPIRRPLIRAGRHGSYGIAGTLYLIGSDWSMPTSPLIPDTIRWAAAEGVGFKLVRFLGPTAQAVGAAMKQFISWSPSMRTPDQAV